MRSYEELRWIGVFNRYVRPFYLKAEWVPHDWALHRRIERAGRKVGLSDVRRMLRGSWRESSVAAWYCLRFPAEAVKSDLHFAMSTAYSTKNAPTLAAACAALLGRQALTMLQAAPCLIDADLGDGAAGVVAAAIEEVGGVPPFAINDDDRAWFQTLLRTARDLQVAYRDS